MTTEVCGFKNKAGIFYDTKEEADQSNAQLELMKAKEDFGNFFIPKIDPMANIHQRAFDRYTYMPIECTWEEREEYRKRELAKMILTRAEEDHEEFITITKQLFEARKRMEDFRLPIDQPKNGVWQWLVNQF